MSLINQLNDSNLTITSDDDDVSIDNITGNSNNKSIRRKSRIPWDRKKDSDRNGLKKDLLDAVLKHQLFTTSNGKLEESFKIICDELSIPGGKFYPYGGIVYYAAQKKVLLLLKDVASLLNVSDETDLDSIHVDTNSFIGVGVELLKAKQLQGEKKLKRVLPPKIDVIDHNLMREYGLERSALLLQDKRRRRSDNLEGNDSDDASTKTDPNEPDHFLSNIVSNDRRVYVSNELFKKGIKVIGDLLNHAGVSDQGIESFVKTTGFKATRPVQIILALFEEIVNSRNCYKSMKRDMGLIPSDCYELIEYLKGIYLEFEQLVKA